MDPSAKTEPRKRQIVGWRELRRRIADIRSRQRTPAVPQPKRAP